MNEPDITRVVTFVPKWVDEKEDLRDIGHSGERIFRAFTKADCVHWSKLMGVGVDPFKGCEEWVKQAHPPHPWTGKKLKIVREELDYRDLHPYETIP